MISSWAHLFVSKSFEFYCWIIPRHRCTCVSNTTFWFVITIINIYWLLQKRRFWVNHTRKPIKDTYKILLFIDKIPTGEWANVNIPSLAMQYLFCHTFRKLKYKDTKKIIKKVTHQNLKWTKKDKVFSHSKVTKRVLVRSRLLDLALPFFFFFSHENARKELDSCQFRCRFDIGVV